MTVPVWAGLLDPVDNSADPSGVHLRDGLRDDGDRCEGGTDNRQQPGTQVVRGPEDVESGDLDTGQDPRGDQRGTNQVLLNGSRQVGGGSDDDRRSNDTSKHRQCVLEPQDHTQQDGHVRVQAEERLRLWRLLGERYFRDEKVTVIVVTNEPFPCGPLTDKSLTERSKITSLNHTCITFLCTNVRYCRSK